MAAMPSGIDSWRNPVVLENTSTEKAGSVGCAAALASSPSIATVTNEYRAARADWRRLYLTALGAGCNLPLTTTRPKEIAMKWKTPVIIEIAVGLEINAYACAEVK